MDQVCCRQLHSDQLVAFTGSCKLVISDSLCRTQFTAIGVYQLVSADFLARQARSKGGVRRIEDTELVVLATPGLPGSEAGKRRRSRALKGHWDGLAKTLLERYFLAICGDGVNTGEVAPI